MDGPSRKQRDPTQIVPGFVANFEKICVQKTSSHFRVQHAPWNLLAKPRVVGMNAREAAQANIFNATGKRFGRCWSTPMYRLSSYVLGSLITALVLTPFVSGPDRSFVGALLATSAPEQIVAVNRTLKGDRRTTNSMLAEHATVPQSIMPKSTRSANNATPASLTSPSKSRVPASEAEAPAAQQRLLDGCESAFSEITDRQLANIPGRCMAALPGRTLQVATLN